MVSKLRSDESRLRAEKIHLVSAPVWGRSSAFRRNGHCARRDQLNAFLRYTVVGAIAACLDLTAYLFLSIWLNVWYLVAHTLSRGLGGMANFALNRRWTFGCRGSTGFWPQLARFAVVYMASYCGSSGLLSFFIELVHIGVIPAKLAAEGAMFFFNFFILFILRVWAFQRVAESMATGEGVAPRLGSVSSSGQ